MENLKQKTIAGAHEVGHTLGMVHNHMGTAYSGCPEFDPARGVGCDATVNDYPAPMVVISEDGELLETTAYAQRAGEFDKVAIEYAYKEPPSRLRGDFEGTKAWLVELIADAERDRGYIFGEGNSPGKLDWCVCDAIAAFNSAGMLEQPQCGFRVSLDIMYCSATAQVGGGLHNVALICYLLNGCS